jgi:hypothetical protein
MQNQQFTVADYLLTRLKQLNVTDVFQIPGDYVKHFTQALEYLMPLALLTSWTQRTQPMPMAGHGGWGLYRCNTA